MEIINIEQQIVVTPCVEAQDITFREVFCSGTKPVGVKTR